MESGVRRFGPRGAPRRGARDGPSGQPALSAPSGETAAFERALARLHYGNIIVNAASGIPYSVVSPPWGAYPGNNPRDIGSGTGFVHNTYLLDDAQKAVTYAPWRPRPKPAWFPTRRRPQEVLRRLAYLEAAPSPLKMPGLFRAALGG